MFLDLYIIILVSGVCSKYNSVFRQNYFNVLQCIVFAGGLFNSIFYPGSDINRLLVYSVLGLYFYNDLKVASSRAEMKILKIIS